LVSLSFLKAFLKFLKALNLCVICPDNLYQWIFFTFCTFHQFIDFCHVGPFYLHYSFPSLLSLTISTVRIHSWALQSMNGYHCACFSVQFLYFFSMPVNNSKTIF
jgi:hypothetical protein